MFWWFFLLFRYLLGPFLLLPLIFLNKKVRERRLFEREFGLSTLEQRQFSYWFHVSSEGELEQIWPILEKLARRFEKAHDFKALLLFTSPSLKNKMMTISQNFPFVTAKALNLLNLNPFGRASVLSLEAPVKFFMVRYDFFPELLIRGNKAKSFVLLSASLKGKTKSFRRNFFKSFYYKLILSSFNQVFAAGEKDFERIENLFDGSRDFSLNAFDFRHGQIIRRQKRQVNIIETHCLDSFNGILSQFEWNERLILGSVWSAEAELFTKEFLKDLKEKKMLIFIAPHKLSGREWHFFEKKLESFKESGLDVCLWDRLGIHGQGNIILCQVPGLLCEIYPYFGHCFVGGGHGRSVHSLLEPYWGGGHIYCGPKTHRSTEFDFIHENSPRHLHIVSELSGLYDRIKIAQEVASDSSRREQARDVFLESEKKYLDELLIDFN